MHCMRCSKKPFSRAVAGVDKDCIKTHQMLVKTPPQCAKNIRYESLVGSFALHGRNAYVSPSCPGDVGRGARLSSLGLLRSTELHE
jgi:hypothetical protein